MVLKSKGDSVLLVLFVVMLLEEYCFDMVEISICFLSLFT